MERRFLAAHEAHGKASKMRRPAASRGQSDTDEPEPHPRKRPSASGMGPAVTAMRVRRRLVGKQPVAAIPDELIREKIWSSKNMACFQSWGYHRVRTALVNAGFADTAAKAHGGIWHRRLKELWVAEHGEAA